MSMQLAIVCSGCQKRLRLSESDLGSQRKCPACGTSLQLPDRATVERTQRAARARQEFHFRCRLCGTLLYAHPDQVGQPLECPDCFASTAVPSPPPPIAKKTVTLDGADEYRLQEPDVASEPKRPGQAAGSSRVDCPVCELMFYAPLVYVGKKVACPDCGAGVLVRPPQVEKPITIAADDPGIVVAETFERKIEKFSADKLLAEGSRHADKVIAARPKPPKRPFIDGIWTIPLQPTVLPRLIVLAIMGVAMTPLAEMVLIGQLKGLETIILGFVSVVFCLLAAITAVLLAAYWMSILDRTATGYNKIDEWPSYDFFERLANVLFFVAPAVFTIAPFLLASSLPYMRWPGIVATIAAVYFLHPILFLSAVDAGSPAFPYSKRVWSSLRIARPDWLKFYLASLPAWLVLAVWIAVALLFPSTWMYASLWLAFLLWSTIQFRLMGRMAWRISQLVVIEESE